MAQQPEMGPWSLVYILSTFVCPVFYTECLLGISSAAPVHLILVLPTSLLLPILLCNILLGVHLLPILRIYPGHASLSPVQQLVVPYMADHVTCTSHYYLLFFIHLPFSFTAPHISPSTFLSYESIGISYIVFVFQPLLP